LCLLTGDAKIRASLRALHSRAAADGAVVGAQIRSQATDIVAVVLIGVGRREFGRVGNGVTARENAPRCCTAIVCIGQEIEAGLIARRRREQVFCSSRACRAVCACRIAVSGRALPVESIRLVYGA
jgi:hypothetical protein